MAVTAASKRIRVGSRVKVPWGYSQHRTGRVAEVWGDPAKPSHIRVEFDPIGDEVVGPLLLLPPEIISPADAA